MDCRWLNCRGNVWRETTLRIDLNAKMPDLPESKSASRQGPAGRVPASEPGLSDEATLAGHSRVRELQRQTQQLPEDGQDRIEALARAIRAGEYDDRWDDVLERVREEVRSKLAVAHPGYDAFADDGNADKES